MTGIPSGNLERRPRVARPPGSLTCNMIANPALIVADNPGPEELPPLPPGLATDRVSVVVPYYQARNKLDLTLAALLRQDYPKELTEIIVVDDGSDPPLNQADLPEGVGVVTQHRDGFGAARARNNGARAATGSILVFVDGDMALPPDNIGVHARWHHRARNLYTILWDIRIVDDSAVDVDNLEGASWRQMEYMTGLPGRLHGRRLIDDHAAPFATLPGPNFALRRDSYWHIGGSSERFKHWGLEDTHLVYRAGAHGLSTVLITETYGLHLGTPSSRSMHLSAALAEQLIPHPRFRRPNQKRSFLVPEYVVSIRSSNPDAVLSCAFDALEHPPHDLAIRVDLPDAASHAEYIRRRLEHDPRVRFGPVGGGLDDFPDSPFQVLVRTDQIPRPGLVGRLRRSLGDRARLTACDGEQRIEIIRSWLAHHRRRYPEHRASDAPLGRVPLSRLVKSSTKSDIETPIEKPRRSGTARALRRIRHVRDVEGNRRAAARTIGQVALRLKNLGGRKRRG